MIVDGPKTQGIGLLPSETLMNVLGYLDRRTLSTVTSLVSKQFYYLSQDIFAKIIRDEAYPVYAKGIPKKNCLQFPKCFADPEEWEALSNDGFKNRIIAVNNIGFIALQNGRSILFESKIIAHRDKRMFFTEMQTPVYRFNNLKGATFCLAISTGVIFIKEKELIYIKNGLKEPSSKISIGDGDISACHVEHDMIFIGTDSGLVHQIVLEEDKSLTMLHENLYNTKKPIKKIDSYFSDKKLILYIHSGNQVHVTTHSGKSLTRISHKISDEDEQDVSLDLLRIAREHCQKDKARDDGTDCSDSPRGSEKCELNLSEVIETTSENDCGFCLNGKYIFKNDQTIFCHDPFEKIATDIKVLLKIDSKHFITQSTEGQITLWDFDLKTKPILCTGSEINLNFAILQNNFLTIVLGDHKIILYDIKGSEPHKTANYEFKTLGKITGISMNAYLMLIAMTDTQKIIFIHPLDRFLDSKYQKVEHSDISSYGVLGSDSTIESHRES